MELREARSNTNADEIAEGLLQAHACAFLLTIIFARACGGGPSIDLFPGAPYLKLRATGEMNFKRSSDERRKKIRSLILRRACAHCLKCRKYAIDAERIAAQTRKPKRKGTP